MSNDFNLGGLADAFGELNQNASQELVKAGLSTGEYLAELDPDDIQLDLDQPRKNVSDKWIAQLSKLIYNNGLEQPPIVELVGDEPVHRIGMCRILAYRKLKAQHPNDQRFQKMPVIVRSYAEKDGFSKSAIIKFAQIIENYGRLNPDPIDEAETIKALVKEVGRENTMQYLADNVKKVSESWVSKRLALASVERSVFNECKDAGVEDIETILIMHKIYNTKRDAFYTLIDNINNNALTGSVRKNAAALLSAINDKKKSLTPLESTNPSGVSSIGDGLLNGKGDEQSKNGQPVGESDEQLKSGQPDGESDEQSKSGQPDGESDEQSKNGQPDGESDEDKPVEVVMADYLSFDDSVLSIKSQALFSDLNVIVPDNFEVVIIQKKAK